MEEKKKIDKGESEKLKVRREKKRKKKEKGSRGLATKERKKNQGTKIT